MADVPPADALRYAGHGLARKVWKHLDAVVELFLRPQWFLLVGEQPESLLRSPTLSKLNPIYPPEDRFWADPFAWSDGPRRFLFFEECFYETRIGHISVLQLGADLKPVGPAIPVISEPRHLSYPFIFEYRGELYMVPESARSRRVDLYRCIEFPNEWAWDRTLIAGLEAADATLFEHQGRWWLFCAARLGRSRINESLFAFYADTPLSERWTPHAGNPLVRDFARGRPGGRIFRDGGGRLLRPSQDSVPRYGYGLRLHEIDLLCPDRYAEHCIWRSSGRAAGDWRAMHHMDWHKGMLAMDAQRLIPASADSTPGSK